MNALFQIVHEDDELLVISKEPDLVCHPTKGDARSSLIGRVRLYLGDAARPHLVNRLDRETSGLVIVAKTSDAALALRRSWETGAVTKNYLAIVHGTVAQTSGQIDAPLARDETSAVAIKNRVRLDGAPALTEFVRVARFERQGRPFTLLRVCPRTGRKHQIRIHLAHLGHPVVGDKLYGFDERCYLDFVAGKLSESQRTQLILPNHALHAESVRFPWRGREASFVAPEPWFAGFGDRQECTSFEHG